MHDSANKRDEWAINRLLSRPLLSSDAEQYWFAFLKLARDRPSESISLGMGGGLLIPRPVSFETIRREGARLGYEADALDDFEEIVSVVDDFKVEIDTRRIAADAQMQAAKAKQKTR